MRRHRLLWKYRCRTCARDYNSFSDAEKCSEACQKNADLSFDREWALLDYKVPRTKRFRPTAIVAPFISRPKIPAQTKQKDISESTTPDEGVPTVAEPFDPPPVELPPIAADVASPPAYSNSDQAKSRKGKDVGFYRDGARYVCETCNTKFFTKEEVMACTHSSS